MPDKPHRSRIGWRDMAHEPTEDDLVPGMPFHYHRPPKWIARSIVGLFLLGALNLAGLTMSLVYDIQQQQYILGRGEFRDAEAERMERENAERDRETACAILEALPPGSLLDQVREEFGCGPGRPLEEFPPEVQRDISGSPSPPPMMGQRPPETARPGPRPDVPAEAPTPATAPAPAQEPGFDPTPPTVSAPAAPPPPAPPAAPPLVDLGPLTNPLCGALGVCL